MRRFQGRVRVAIPADLGARLYRLVPAAAVAELLDQFGVGHRGAIAVTHFRGEFDRHRAECRDIDGHRLLGQCVDPSFLHVVVLAPVADLLAGVQPADHLDGLFEHLEPNAR